MMFWQLHLLGLLLWAIPAHSLTSFDTNCTIPDHSYNYVQGPNTRGTLQIVWSCLATLIACTYTVLHLKVPEQRDGRDGGVEDYLWKGTRPGLLRAALTTMAPVYPLFNDKLLLLAENKHSLRSELSWWWKSQVPSVKWMIIAMVAPEYYATIGFNSLLSAWRTKAALKELPLTTCVHPAHGWTLTHAFFADMGGFAIQVRNKGKPRQIIHLDVLGLVGLLRHESTHNWINRLPNQGDIEDRSKSDTFIKGIIILQIGYFTLGCTLRLAYGIPVTQLEMSILGTAICSLVTYSALFKKPHRVKTPFILLTFPGRVPEHIQSELDLSDTLPASSSNRPNNYWIERGRTGMMLLIFPSVLGAFHVAAWNFEFPLAIDRWVWRSASLVSCVVIPLAFALLICLPLALEIAGTKSFIIHEAMTEMIIKGAVVLYCLSRMVIAVEMIRLVFYIPPGAFLTTWVDNVPHI